MAEPSTRTMECNAETQVACEPSPPAAARCAEPTPASELTAHGFESRYEITERIGQGGMGVVELAWDRRLRRGVALKSLHPSQAKRGDRVARFEREARIQGQLEHPGVVPVYDLGVRSDASLFFTMKRVRGLTLEHVIDGLASGDGELEREYGVRRLLSAFVTVCLTVEFAHQSGVLHRDLKPANVILGEYGEVHVLDWGIARLIDEADGTSLAPPPIDTGPDGAATVAGSLVGTPGYMAPEQCRGARLDRRSDVYALGAILFEILAREPLHPQPDAQQRIASTLHGLDDPRPGARGRRAVAPELDVICERALELDADARFQSARALADAVQAHLDGAQDVARRAALAGEYVERAREALTAARSDPELAVEHRGRAIRELSAAVSLDPAAREPLELLARALAEVPSELPRAADAALAAHRGDQRRQAARSSGMALLVMVAMIPVLGFFTAGGFGGLVPLFVLVSVYTGWMWFLASKARMTRFEIVVSAVIGAGVAASLANYGPFVLVPTVALGIGVIIIVHAKADRAARLFVIATSALAILVPYLLARLGLLPDHYVFDLVAMRGRAGHVGEEHPFNLTLLAFGALVAVAVPIAVLGRTMDQLLQAERRLFGQAWQLEQLMAARPAPDRPLA